MLGKAVLTLTVIIVAILVIKQRNDQQAGRSEEAAKGKTGDAETGMASDLRFAAYAFLVLMFGTGAFLYYQRWQDDHTVLTVNLYRAGQTEPTSYEVYKYELDERSFTTLTGVRITVADNERMEVTGLE
jgi:hypothetical protein